jgi:tol-pal system protein YbgF
MKILKTLVMMAAALAAAACASTSDLERAQDQVSELQQELANVKRTASSKEEVQSVNTRIAEQTEMLLKSNATLVTKVDEIDNRIQTAQNSIEQNTYRTDQLAQQLAQTQRELADLRSQIAAMQQSAAADPSIATPSTGGGAPAPSGGQMTVPASPAADPLQTYQAAYRDYQRGNFDLAIDGFREYVQDNGDSDLADNAAYWIGESLFSQKKYREAIAQFDSVVTKYPKSDKVPGALLKKGYAYININERAQGVVQLQYVLHEHPQSQEASLARQKLKQLGIETK